MKQGRDADADSGFPLVLYYLDEWDDSLEDNKPSNFATYVFAIDVVCPLVGKTKSDTEADFQDAVEAVLNKFRANWQLGGNADATSIRKGQIQQREYPFGPCVVAPLRLEVRTLIS